MIILIGGEKGGTGKTTIATNLAQMRTAEGKDVLLIDTDKQQSASSWAGLRDENEIIPRITTIEKTGKSITRDIMELAEKFDDVIIDSGGRDTFELRAAMVACDRLYIPIQAAQFDVWTLEVMEELIDNSQALNPKLEAFLILNRASPNPLVSETKEAQELVQEDYGKIPFSGITIRDRIAYRKAAAAGQGVKELHPHDPKATQEMNNLYRTVFEDAE